MGLTSKGQPGGLATLGTDGRVPGAQVAQAAAVADHGALTAAAPTAMTQAAITGGESPTEAEFNALRTDLVNTRTALAAHLVDLASIRTKLNAALGSLRTAELLDT